jgi:hypothetical protein
MRARFGSAPRESEHSTRPHPSPQQHAFRVSCEDTTSALYFADRHREFGETEECLCQSEQRFTTGRFGCARV